MNDVKNKNLFIRVSQKEKNIIELNAEKCGLSVSEYLRQRALGYMPRTVLPEVFFSFNDKLDELCVELCKLITGNNITPQTPRPLYPEIRQEVVKLDKTLKEYKFLCENHIDSPQELVSFISEKREQISALQNERQFVYNRNRHKKSKELNVQAREITAKIKLLREELSVAKAVLAKIPKLKELLEIERQTENDAIYKTKERGYTR